MFHMPHFLYDYETRLRSCFSVIDDFGNLLPCNRNTYVYLFPEWQVEV